MALRLLICLALMTGAWVVCAGEDAKAEPAKSEAPKTDAEAPKDAPKDGAAAPPAAVPVKGGGAAFPVQSEFFQFILDNQMEDQSEAQQIELNAMRDILRAVDAATDKQLEEAIDPKADFRELMLRAEKYRGHVVRVRGLLENVETMKMTENSPLEKQSQFYRGQISNLRGEIVTFISLKPPEGTGKVPVRLTGVFMKRYAYLNRQEGEKLTWTPLVFVRFVEDYTDQKEKEPTSPVTYAATAILMIAFVCWFGFRVSRFSAQRKFKNPFTKKKQQLADKK